MSKFSVSPSHLIFFVAGIAVSLAFTSSTFKMRKNDATSAQPTRRQVEAGGVVDARAPSSSSPSSLRDGGSSANQNRQLLETFFACSPQKCFVPPNNNCNDGDDNDGRYIRIAFVGDSIMYGNATHDTGRLRGKALQIGSWPMDVIQSLRQRADECEGSVFSLSKDNDKTIRPFLFDARNFGMEQTSVTCAFNDITQKLKFKRAVKFQPHVLIFGVGSNDVWVSRNCSNYSASRFAERYEAALDQFLWRSSSSSSSAPPPEGGNSRPRITILVTPPPMVATWFTAGFGFQPKLVSDEIVPEIKKIGRRRNLPVLDVFGAWKELLRDKQLEQRLLIGDGVHPTLQGHLGIAKLFDDLVCHRS